MIDTDDWYKDIPVNGWLLDAPDGGEDAESR